MHKPLAIELFAGLFGWGEGLIAEGYETLGFDIVNMFAEIGMERRQEFNLVLQDVLTLHGSQFKDAALIVASPPCQAYSYRAMPWKRAKALPPPSNELFDACFRIQREACAAAGRHIPMIVENVRGAIPWVGRSRWNYGSFHLWGDVPALMPMSKAVKRPEMNWSGSDKPGYKAEAFNAVKVPGFRFDGSGKSFQTASVEGIKQRGSGREWFAGDGKISRMTSSGSPARKRASAMIAKIPLPLSRYIAKTFYPVLPTAQKVLAT